MKENLIKESSNIFEELKKALEKGQVEEARRLSQELNLILKEILKSY